MKHSTVYYAAMLVTSMLSLVAGQPFDLAWNTVDNGGAMHSGGGPFVLSGTIGQPDAGAMTGGSFKLTGGFWFETPPGDSNGNGAVGLLDHEAFVACLSGPDTGIGVACESFNIDSSLTIDLADFAVFQTSFTGE